MKEPLATVDELRAMANEPIETAEDQAQALSILNKVSAKARHYGRESWTKWTVPDIVKAVVIDAASRGYENPAAWKNERGDMVNFERDAISSAGAKFTDEEVKQVREAARRGGITSVQLVRPDTVITATVSNGA
jgi:hypothetical protein